MISHLHIRRKFGQLLKLSYTSISKLLQVQKGLEPDGEFSPARATGISLFFKKIIYLFMRYTQREAETYAEGEAGSMRGG